MADRESWSSSEDNLSDESDSNLVNLYDSDVENSVEHSGSRPYEFEPRRVGTKRATRSQPKTILPQTTTTRTVLETQTGIKLFCN